MKQITTNGTEPMAGEALIRKVLLTNAVSSGATGLVLLLFPHFVMDWTGLDNRAALMGTGIFLLIIVTFLLWTASKNVVSPRNVLIFSILDFVWVIDSIILLCWTGPNFTISAIGIAAVILVAVVVGVFALFEGTYYWNNRFTDK